MKSLILAAFLFLGSTAAYADDHVWWASAVDIINGATVTAEYSMFPDSVRNKAQCLSDLAEVYDRLKMAGVDQRVELKCTQDAPI